MARLNGLGIWSDHPHNVELQHFTGEHMKSINISSISTLAKFIDGKPVTQVVDAVSKSEPEKIVVGK